mmetsp:Transcript_5506/g.16249  ORF Transcript_5506/g.16249 Transcript_5506/m.16249 type:complete len:356 (+) Transcript_5506:98-1165(+)
MRMPHVLGMLCAVLVGGDDASAGHDVRGFDRPRVRRRWPADGPGRPGQGSAHPNQRRRQRGGARRHSAGPMASFEPSLTSFHPKWKLWTEMSLDEQDRALDEAGAYLARYGARIMGGRRKNKIHGECVLDPDIGKNGHKLCGPKPEKPCAFLSFGINDDASFDRDVATHWGCRGFAGDPTVQHPSKLHDLVTFHNIGASLLQSNEERLIDKGGSVEWWLTSMPRLRHFLGLERIALLKLDCEGCEVAFARDILREDADFLKRVDQVSIETHVTKTWMTTREHVYYFGLHFALLEEAGFKLEWSSVFGCAKRHEVTGCLPEIEKYGFPCGFDPWPGHPNVVKGRSCHEFTWKRYDV